LQVAALEYSGFERRNGREKKEKQGR
jgi:hypothetical protein